MIGFAVVLVTILLMAGSFAAFVSGDGKPIIAIILLIAAVCCAYQFFTNPFLIEERETENQERQKMEALCRTPKLNASIDGINVYVYRDGCRGELVYFSKSMTKTRRCHTEGAGKTSHQVCKDFVVTNAE